VSDAAVGPADPVATAERRLRLAASLTRGAPPPPFDEGRVAWPAYVADAAAAALAVPAAERMARAVGVVGHLLFEGLALAMRETSAFAPSAAAIARALIDAGAVDDGLTPTQASGAPRDTGYWSMRLAQWFAAASGRDNLRFLFASTHLESRQEFSLPLAAAAAGERLRVDHSFVTAEGVRWIVDYKFAEPDAGEAAEAAAVDAWVARQCAQYAAQLAGYRAAFAHYEHERERAGADDTPAASARPIVTALYFPWLDRLQACQ